MLSAKSLSGRYFISVLIAIAVYAALFNVDALEQWHAFTRAHDDWELDEVPLIFIVVSLWFAWIFHAEYRAGEKTLSRLKREIAERKAAESRATKALMAREQFFAAASHDLRTPLNSVLGFSEIIKDEAVGPIGNAAYRDYGAAIHVSGGILLRTVNQIIDIARLGDTEFPLDESIFDPDEVLREAELSCLFAIREKDIKLSFASEVPGMRIRFDRTRFGQLMQNLIGNAVKYSPDGSEIRVTSLVSDSRLSITVEDHGIGMSTEESRRLLEPFQRSDDPRVRAIEGSGLGLSIVRSIVDRHGGVLLIESEKRKGTRVKVMLPPERIILPENH